MMPPKRPPSAPRPGRDPSMSEEALARERDAKFKQWLQNKAIKDKAFEVTCEVFPSIYSYDYFL